MPSDLTAANAVNRLLRHHVAKILFDPADDPLKDALRSLAAHRRPPGGDERLADLISPPIQRADLEEPRDPAREIIEELQGEARQQDPPPEPPRPRNDGGRPTGPGERGGTDNPDPDQPPRPTPDDGREPPRSLPEPKLILELTRIKADRLTWPEDDEDEFIVTGGYVYSSGHGPLDRWKQEILNTDPVAIDPPHILSSVPVLAGVPQVFNATIILLEEDWVDADTATDLGRIISIVLNLGIEALVNYLTATGLPATLSSEARDLLTNHGITGVRSWFESLAGPETFEIFMLRATTNWPIGQPWQPVPWDSWIPQHPNVRPTTPPSSVGPKTHVGDQITSREARVTSGAAGPVMTVVGDGGIYKLNFQFRLVV